MSGTPMDLLALSAFQQIADHGGIGRASRATGQPKTTLSRRLRELEEQLGVRLAERGVSVFRLTEEGLALAARTRHLLAEIEEAGQAVGGGLAHPRGRLRVSTPSLFADLHMGTIAAGFIGRYPEVELAVVGEDRVIDPVAEGIDVVIRVNPRPQEGLVGRPFLRDDLLLVAAASLQPPSGDGSGATVVPAIFLPTTGAPSWQVENGHGVLTVVPRPVLHLSSVMMAWRAVRCGVGAAMLPRSVVEADLRDGTLVCWGRLPDRTAELWVLHTSRRLRSPKVAAFVEFICTSFATGQATRD